MTSTRTSRRTSRRALAASVLAGALLLSGCGNTLSTQEIHARSGDAPQAAVGATSTDTAAGTTGTGADGITAASPGAGIAQPPTDTSAGNDAATVGSPGDTKGDPVKGATKTSPPTQPATQGGGSAQTCTATKAPIVIGTVGQKSGPLGAALIGGVRAVQAWVASVNATGGLSCHPVKYVVADDGGDPSRHISLVRKLVEQDGVIAMVYQDALLTGQASKKYVEEKGIPIVGQEGGETHTFDAPIYFNHASAGAMLFDMTVAAGAKVAVPEGKTKLGTLVCQEVAGCATAGTRFAARAAEVGFETVYQGKASLLTVDFTSQCISARNAGVQALAVSFESTGIHRIAQSCASVGYKPIIICTSVQSTLDFVDDPNLEGAVVAQPLAPWFLDRLPAVQKFQTTLKKYSPGTPFDASSMNGWGAAQLFAQATAAFAADTVTSHGIIAALSKLKGNDLGGLTYPLTFTPGKPQQPAACGWVVRVAKGAFTSDGKRFCL